MKQQILPLNHPNSCLKNRQLLVAPHRPKVRPPQGVTWPGHGAVAEKNADFCWEKMRKLSGIETWISRSY
jgi:hypothetical protein